jgi:SAM-dependent methyltransferase
MPDASIGLQPGDRPYAGTAWFYAEYRDRPSVEFAELLARRLGWSRSDRILDLGAGPAQVSLRLAPFVREVIAMDPERDMLEEGRRRTNDAGISNVSFVEGGSDDLASLAPTLGAVKGATMSQAFHWVGDKDGLLRDLDRLLDPEGAVALVGFVKDPDPNRIWLDRLPWCNVEAIRIRYVADVPEGPHPRGRHDPFPDILGRSAFSELDLLTHAYDAVIHPSVDAAIGYEYTLSNVLARLGDRRYAFEAEARAALAGADTSPIHVELTDSALVGRRPSGQRHAA